MNKLIETQKPTDSSEQEKRKFLRMPDKINVLFCEESLTDEHVVYKEGLAVNLGGGGMKLITGNPLMVESRVSLIFKLELDVMEEYEINTRGRVKYKIIEDNKSGSFGYGIAFEYINANDQDKIVSYILKRDAKEKTVISQTDLIEYLCGF